GAIRAAPRLRQLLLDFDPDVAAAAAHALADLGDRDAVPGIRAALAQATFAETRIDLATSLSLLGSTDGMPVLLENLDHGDELIRQDSFEQLFDLTGKHFGFDPHQPRDQRLAAIASLQAWWARDGGAHALRHPYTPEPATFEQAFTMVVAMDGGDTMVPAAEDDQKVLARLVALGQDARLALRKGLKFPPGFANKRALVLTAIHRIGDQNAAPFACQALRDPVLGVAAYAVQALESCGDADCLPALRRFQARVLSTAAAGQLPANIPSPDRLLAATARTRLLLGDDPARSDLVNLLLSDDDVARATAITTLQQKFGDARGYDAAAAPAERRRAAARWTE
ncbi:MAG TPA: HEAT repeat domain-containing protein, partial [Planctomycetota bacterium]|nr:HEAT repeat domain-containing protein [Planctomycetota bacterium]